MFHNYEKKKEESKSIEGIEIKLTNRMEEIGEADDYHSEIYYP